MTQQHPSLFFLVILLISVACSLPQTLAQTSPRTDCSDGQFFDILSWKCRTCPEGYNQYGGQYATCFCDGKFDGSIGGFYCVRSGTTDALDTFAIQASDAGVIQSSPTTLSAPDYANGNWIKRYTYKSIELNSQGKSLFTSTGSPAMSVNNIPKLYASGITTYNYNTIDDTAATVTSQALIFHLDHAVFMLTSYGYHQKLANLCALTLLDITDSNRPCLLYKSNFSQATTSTVTILKTDADLAIFNANCTASSTQTCSTVHGLRLPTKQSDQASTLKSYLNLKVMVFDLDGNLIDKMNLKGSLADLDNQLFLCPSSDLDGENLKEFGTNFRLSCSINLRSFISDRTLTKYYQLFIETETGTFAEVPVYNADSAITTPQYSSRFIILDNISGFTSVANSDAQKANTYLIPEKIPSFITIAQTMTLKIRIQPGSNNIDMPVLAITYAAFSVDSITNNDKVSVSFTATYSQGASSFTSNAQPIFIIGGVFTGLLWLVKFNIWSKYNPQSRNLSPESFFFLWVVNGINILINLWSDYSFYIMFFMTGYWFITYKLQENLYTLMINWGTEYDLFRMFQIMIIIQYSFKKATFLKFLYRQLQTDVLFVDWENQKQYDEDSQEEEKRRGVSIWRTLFIANEFNELSVTRVTSFEWTLFWVGFFLTGLKWDNLGQEVPFISVSDRNYVAMNQGLRYFIAAFVYIVIVLIQIIFKQVFIIWNPTPIQDFTDLCTVANISIFMLDDQLHGYYLHGKAPSGVAEGNTFWLKEAIEQESVTGAYRGLVKGDTLQTFEMYIPIDLRLEFTMEYSQKFDQLRAMFNQNEWILGKTVKKEMIYEMEKQKFHLHIINLIKTYIKEVQIHSYNHVLNKSFLHRLISLPPTDPLQSGLPFFFRDPGMNYSKIFYYGNEWYIIMFEMINFLFYNYWTESPLASIMITFVFNRIFETIRDVFGRRNISAKTMIDQRFLI